MNDKMFELIGQADEEYLREAEGTSQMKIKHKRRISAKIIAVAAAAACLTTVGAFAAYNGINRDTIGGYYDSSAIDSMESRGYAVGQTVENAHFRLTVESVLRDKGFIRIMLTTVPLDEAAVNYLKENPMIATTLSYSDNGQVIETGNAFMALNDLKDEDNDQKHDDLDYEVGKPVGMVLDEQYYSEGTEVGLAEIGVEIDTTKSLNIRFESENYNHKDDYRELFNGLTYNLGIPKQADEIEFVVDDGNKISISEFSVSLKYPEPIVEKYPSEGETLENYEGKIIFKDGSTMTIGTEKKGFLTKDGIVESEGENKKFIIQGGFWRLRTLIDPADVDSFEFQGKTYKVK